MEDLVNTVNIALSRGLGPTHPMTTQNGKYLANLNMHWGKIDQAEEELKDLVPIVQKSLHITSHVKSLIPYQLVKLSNVKRRFHQRVLCRPLTHCISINSAMLYTAIEVI